MATKFTTELIQQEAKKVMEISIYTDDLLGFELIPSESLICLSFIDGTTYYYGEPDGRPHQERTKWYRDQTDPQVYRYSNAKELAEHLEFLRKVMDGEIQDEVFSSIVPIGTYGLLTVIPLYRLVGGNAPIVMKVSNDI